MLQKGMLREIVHFQAKKKVCAGASRISRWAGFGEEKEAAHGPGWLPGVTESGPEPGQPCAGAPPCSAALGLRIFTETQPRGRSPGEAANVGIPLTQGTPGQGHLSVKS